MIQQKLDRRIESEADMSNLMALENQLKVEFEILKSLKKKKKNYQFIPMSGVIKDLKYLNNGQWLNTQEKLFSIVQINDTKVVASGEIQNSENVIGEDKIKLDYFERAKSEDFDLKTIRWLRGNLNVVKEAGANVLSINFTSINPELSKLIANSISEEYLDYQRISKESADYTLLNAIRKIDELREKQDNLSSKILEFESANDIYDSKVENLELDLRELKMKLKI